MAEGTGLGAAPKALGLQTCAAPTRMLRGMAPAGAGKESPMHTRFVMTATCAIGLLAACSPQPDAHAGNAFPMAAPTHFDAPIPSKPLFGDPIVTALSVLPPSKPDVRAPLPPQAALPQATATEAAPKSDGPKDEGGAVNPAAGQAAAISDGQGEGDKQQLGAPK